MILFYTLKTIVKLEGEKIYDSHEKKNDKKMVGIIILPSHLWISTVMPLIKNREIQILLSLAKLKINTIPLLLFFMFEAD